jgi:homocysteine S-methyltransferase
LTKTQLLELLRDRVLLCDGAMGTMLYNKGVYLNTCFDELNLAVEGVQISPPLGRIELALDVLEVLEL